MDRRDFIKSGAMGVVGVALGATAPWLSPSAALAASKVHRENGNPWKFGVMADTQWGKNVDGQNPGTCALAIITLLNAEFIKHDAKFVIQVGDLVDKEDDATNGHAGLRNMPTRAAAAKGLYDNGIGFYPLRGNHEGSVTGANEFVNLYPQARGFGHHVFGGRDFSSPSTPLDGLSYSFDFGNVRFLMLDQFVRADGTGYNNVVTTNVDNNIVDQQPWISESLSTRSKGSHAFVLSHKNLIGQNHTDCLFGASPATNPDARNAFIGGLQANGVRYYLGGHDHMHHRSVVASPDGTASVKQVVCSSNSYKFYYPEAPSNDTTFNPQSREISAAQELTTIGYYIFTVEGPRVTVDFYSSTTGLDYGDADSLSLSPTHTAFYKRETFGYSLNGKEFLVAQGDSYTPVQDGFRGTVARILGGTNQSPATDAAARPLTKTVNTGWSSPWRHGDDAVASHILSLWGTADSLSLWDKALTGLLPSEDRTKKGDTYALSISYDGGDTRGIHVDSGRFGIGSRDANGRWVNAVSKNIGGTKRFVVGPWSPSYGLGTYGVDARTKTAWAVLDHDGDFAAASGL